MVQHYLTADILIAGGGPAGVPCAIAAARNGAKVILCQDRSMLGGNASSEVRMHIVGANGGRRDKELECETRESGIIEEIRLETCVRNPQRAASMLDLILYELVKAEPNITLMLDTAVVGVRKSGRTITHALAQRTSTEDSYEIEAKIFIDCTGDGRMGYEAGASYRMGREAQNEFNESLANEQADNCTLGSTILFQASKYEKPIPFIAPSWAKKYKEEDFKYRPHGIPGVDNGLEYGYWWVEWGGELDTIKDQDKIRHELLSIVMGVWDHIKNGGDHGAEKWALDWFGFLPAKRESRRFVGQHVLRESDVLQSHSFPDAIAYGGWPIDVHPPKGMDAPDEEPCTKTIVPNLFDIPLRACVSKDLDNLMFAGRNMSATHIAFASTRVMATCAVIGQGVGTAAACAIQSNIPPANLAGNQQAIRKIQQILLRDDAYLIALPSEIDGDLAQSATITASSNIDLVKEIRSGENRSVHGLSGAPSGRAKPGPNRWMSDPKKNLPAWIELSWDKPVNISEVRIVFDTGLHRTLTLSHSDDYVKHMIWGKPQPETVRDYSVEIESSGKLCPVATVNGNYQRIRIHRFDSARQASKLRITIHATNGLDHARIMSIMAF